MDLITTMDRATAISVRDILERELPAILEPHGLSFKLGNAKYDDDSVKFNGFVLSVAGGRSEMEKGLNRELEYRAEHPLMVTLDADKVVNFRGDPHKLVGYKSRNRKYPFIVRNLTNEKNYKFTASSVERDFAADTEEA